MCKWTHIPGEGSYTLSHVVLWNYMQSTEIPEKSVCASANLEKDTAYNKEWQRRYTMHLQTCFITLPIRYLNRRWVFLVCCVFIDSVLSSFLVHLLPLTQAQSNTTKIVNLMYVTLLRCVCLYDSSGSQGLLLPHLLRQARDKGMCHSDRQIRGQTDGSTLYLSSPLCHFAQLNVGYYGVKLHFKRWKPRGRRPLDDPRSGILFSHNYNLFILFMALLTYDRMTEDLEELLYVFDHSVWGL